MPSLADNERLYYATELGLTAEQMSSLSLADLQTQYNQQGKSVRRGDTSVGFFSVPPVARPTALTPTANAAPAGGLGSLGGGWDTAENRNAAIATINNLRTRVNEMEAKLKALGLLT